MEFQQQYHSLLRTIQEYRYSTTLQAPTPSYLLYQPYEVNDTTTNTMIPSFSNTTLMNIIKMWHSQQSVFELMEESSGATATSAKKKPHYSRVGMFRNDVLYVTPIDIYEIPKSTSRIYYDWNPHRNNRRSFRRSSSTSTLPQVPVTYDRHNQYAVIPNFANYPVNDRMIYGPYDAIRIYATYKFRTLYQHIHSPINVQHHYGIHSEQYLYHTILPLIQQYGRVTVLQHSNICFLRVRTDYSVRIGDCGTNCITHHNIQTIIEEQLLFRSCQLDRTLPHVPFLLCPPPISTSTTSTAESTSTIGYNRTVTTMTLRNMLWNTTLTIPPQWESCSPTL